MTININRVGKHGSAIIGEILINGSKFYTIEEEESMLPEGNYYIVPFPGTKWKIYPSIVGKNSDNLIAILRDVKEDCPTRSSDIIIGLNVSFSIKTATVGRTYEAFNKFVNILNDNFNQDTIDLSIKNLYNPKGLILE